MGATYVRRGKKSWLIAVHWNGERERKTVHGTEADAKAIVQHIHKQELAGINVVEAIRQARVAPEALAPTPEYPTLRVALGEWLDRQERSGEIRPSTAKSYRGRLATWVYPHALPDGRALGDLAVNEVTRDMFGAVIWRVREAGRSLGVIDQIRNPLRGCFVALIEAGPLKDRPNPAADLKFFVGRGVYRKAKGRTSAYFSQEEGPQLAATAKAAFPRWHAFVLTGLLAGLRWGESASLCKTDIDWKRGRLHVQRTYSQKGRRIELCKDGEDRWVKASPALLDALRRHIDAVNLEGQVRGWAPEQRQLVFPNRAGRIVGYTAFLEHVWQPLLLKAGLPYRKYHATRHTFATWLLEDGADLRWVQHQMGHATIAQTSDTYGHVAPDRHEAAVIRLDQYVGG
jgi:integrase